MDDAAALHEQLIRLANHFGSQTDYARAGGGNASVKHDGVLHIKPSGTTLADLRDADLVPLRIDVLMAALTSDDPVDGDPVIAAANAARIGDSGGRRPSVEILFHALIPDDLVLHLHPLVANAVTCNESGKALARQLLDDEAVWVDYIDPGVPLARGINEARKACETRTGRPAPSITLLGNHGIIVSGNTYQEVAERTEWLTTTIQAAIDQAPAPQVHLSQVSVDVEAMAEAFRSAVGAAAVTGSSEEFVRANSSLASGPVSRGPLIPDQIVYSGSLPVRLPEDAARVAATVAEFETERGRTPVVAVVPGQAVFAVGATDRAARNALDTFLDALRVARDADRLGEVRVMDARERHFIETWEAEAYRQSVAAEA
ncbi:class II aldolase/adducin family protein [Tessaracoccus sp. OS52]|uniref:class II aldolase/adducin family protein n=1 Tax=Tessaracoccus sp. OS52 TaxID=2886691 RepID=UPI001D1009D7|nr:class II aldolase/adducin family protein [Tessaracoccus sp. OS52]MCC2592567.1 class II aldolase/adducin family protein [Tessaracoccus sp. OS52]